MQFFTEETTVAQNANFNLILHFPKSKFLNPTFGLKNRRQVKISEQLPLLFCPFQRWHFLLFDA